MAGFLLEFRDSAPVTEHPWEGESRAAIEAGGRVVVDEMATGDMRLLLFKQAAGPSPCCLRLGGDDFIAACGTLLYDGHIGERGLRALHADVSNEVFSEDKLAGNFAVILRTSGRLLLFNDRLGFYQVYRDQAGRVFSNSLLLCRRLARATGILRQELLEYVLFGFFFHRQTLFDGIRILDANRLWQLQPACRDLERPESESDIEGEDDFATVLEKIRENLRDYFKMLGRAFDGSFSSALSGGYDSRLMLAALRNLGFSPHLYVYGGANHPDVCTARAIATGESLALDHVDKGALARPDVDAWLADLHRDYWFFDGLKATGLFDNGSDYATRVERAVAGRLQLNGAGGEIYREIWNLPNRSLSLDRFLRMRYDQADYGFVAGDFDRNGFFARLETKTRKLLGGVEGRISRLDVERLFPLLRNRFAGANTAINNQLGPSILPYMEPRFVYQSYSIPIRFKNHGRLNAALIQSLDPALAAYPSAYGHSFDGRPEIKARTRTHLRQNVPLRIRLWRRRNQFQNRGMPFYLEGEYRQAVFGDRELAISEYVDPDRIADPVKRSRALTVEFLIGDHL